MNDQEKYALYKQAKQTGGPCQICNWRDGDGVRTCFYSSELGVVTHQNSEKGIMASMTDAQRDLYQLRQELVYVDEECRQKRIQLVAQDHHTYVKRMLAQNPDRYPTQDEHGNSIDEEAWVARYQDQQMEKGLATDQKFAGWLPEYWWVPVDRQADGPIPPTLRGPEKVSGTEKFAMTFTAYMVHMYEPHCCNKGHKYQVGPYHLACTGCDTEIKLWEHGVDYDMG